MTCEQSLISAGLNEAKPEGDEKSRTALPTPVFGGPVTWTIRISNENLCRKAARCKSAARNESRLERIGGA